MRHVDATPPKYQQVLQRPPRRNRVGTVEGGDRLPSEAELSRKTFNASRITVSRALRDLQLAGMVERRVGLGHLRRIAGRVWRALVVRMLMPDLGETEIFEPMLQAMMALTARAAASAALGRRPANGPGEGGDRAGHAASSTSSESVGSVLRAARAHRAEDDGEPSHRACADAREDPARAARSDGASPTRRARPPRSRRHRQPSRRLSRHRAPAARRVHERSRSSRVPHAAPTVDARRAGYREALHRYGAPVERDLTLKGRSGGPRAVRRSWRGAPGRDRLRQRSDGRAVDADAARARRRVPATSASSASTTCRTRVCCRSR